MSDENDMSVILVSAGYDQSIKFWEALSGICNRTIQNEGQVNRMAITPDKKYLACAGPANILLYDIRSPKNSSPVLKLEGHTANVTAIAIQAEGKWLVSSSEDGTCKVWDMRTGAVQRSFEHQSRVTDVVIHPNQGEIITSDYAGNVRVWDLTENSCTHQLIPEENVPVRSVSVASDGSMVVAGNNNGNVYVWRMFNSKDMTKLQPITKFRAHSKYITKVLLSPDIKHLATCSADTTARIWSTERQFQLETTLQHGKWVWDINYSADSCFVSTASSDCQLRLFQLDSGAIIRQYAGHSKGVLSCALNDL